MTGGATIYEGQVEVFINGQWGTVCGDGIGTSEAETLCQSLGFGPFQSIMKNFTSSTGVPVLVSDLICSEYYDHFLKCTFNQSSPECSSLSNLGLKCHRKLNIIALYMFINYLYMCVCVYINVNIYIYIFYIKDQ